MLEYLNGYAGGLLIVLFGILYCKIIIKKPIVMEKWKLIIIVLVMTAFFQLLYLLELDYIRSFCFFLAFAIIFKYSFAIEMNKALLLSFFYIAIAVLSDIIVILFFVSIFGETFFYNVIAGGILSNICVLIPSILLTLIFQKLLRKLVRFNFKYNMVYYSILILVCLVSIFYSVFSYTQATINSLLALFCMLSLLLVLINSFVQAYRNSQLVGKYDKLLEFIRKYELEIDNQRMLRHETKNQLLTIKSKIIDKDNNKNIISYIDEVINDNKKVNRMGYARFKDLPSNGIKGLFYFKVSEALDKQIKVDISVSNSICKSFLKDININSFNQIGKILGIYLDNAIEASAEALNKRIGIEVFMQDEDVIFIISNSYKILNMSLFNRSTKGPNRGYGLLLANSIIKSNSQYESSNEIINDLYIQKFVIKKNC